MSIRKWILVVLINLLTIVNLVSGTDGSVHWETDPNPDFLDWGSMTDTDLQSAPDSYLADAIADGLLPADQYQHLTPEQIATHLDNIPADRMSGLTFTQVSHGDTLERLKGSGKYDDLNKDVLRQVIDNHVPDRNIDVTADENTNDIERTENGFTADHFASLSVDTTLVINANDIRLDGDTLFIGHADSITLNGKDVLTNVDNFQLSPERFQIQHADLVLVSCDGFGTAILHDVRDSTFRNNGELEISTNNEISYPITDCGGNNIQLTANNNSVIIIKKDLEPEYFLDEGVILELLDFNTIINAISRISRVKITNLGDSVELTTVQTISTFENDNIIETILAIGETKIIIDKNEGIYYASLGSPARLSFKDKINPNASFILFRPNNLNTDFELAINKPSHPITFQQYLAQYAEESGFVDLANNFIFFRGILDYSRFDNFKRPHKTIESMHPKNQITINLDAQNKNIDVEITNGISCTTEEIFASTSTSNYNIIEICNPFSQTTERYVAFSQPTTNFIQSYNSNFGRKHSPMLFNNDLLTIQNKETTAVFHSEETAKVSFQNELMPYNNQFNECPTSENSLFNWYIQ